MTSLKKLSSDFVHSLTLWHVWIFLGFQDVKGRFRGSFIGPLWLVLNMVFFVGGAGIVYGVLFNQPMNEFLPFLTTGFVMWGFIVSTLTESGFAFVNAEGYIKQFSYPKQIYLARVLVSYVIVLLIGLSILIPLQLFYRTFNVLGWILALPGIIILSLAAFGHITLLAYLGARFRDLPHAMGGLLQVLFFVTPIMFPAKVLAARNLDFVYQYNPLYYLIEVVRNPILSGEMASSQTYLAAIFYVIAVWFVAVIVAKRYDSRLVFLL